MNSSVNLTYIIQKKGCLIVSNIPPLIFSLIISNEFCMSASREIFHPLHFDLHMQMLEQQISGSQSKVLGVVLRYHPQLRMEGGIVGDTQCKAIQFVLLAVVVKVGKMDTDLLLTHNGYMLGGGNIETAVIAVTFRGAYLAAAGRSERVGRPQHDSRHVFPELPLLQHTQTGGKVAVLVRESAVPVWLQSQRLRLEERTRVGHFQKGEDGDVQEVVVGMIVPGGRCELLVQEVAADHESLVALHLRRGRMQQPVVPYVNWEKAERERLQNRTIKNSLNFIITYKFSR